MTHCMITSQSILTQLSFHYSLPRGQCWAIPVVCTSMFQHLVLESAIKWTDLVGINCVIQILAYCWQAEDHAYFTFLLDFSFYREHFIYHIILFIRVLPLCGGRPIVITLSVRASGPNRVRPRFFTYLQVYDIWHVGALP